MNELIPAKVPMKVPIELSIEVQVVKRSYARKGRTTFVDPSLYSTVQFHSNGVQESRS